MGEKDGTVPSYFACIAPRKNNNSSYLSRVNIPVEEGDHYIKGTPILCLSYTYSEVARCNDRMVRNTNSEVGGIIWKSIARLGVSTGMVVYDGLNIKFFEELERKDRLGMKSKKELISKLS